MENNSLVTIERKIEKIIYQAALALDENNWADWFKLCDDSMLRYRTIARSRADIQLVVFPHR
jgi:3-phenylpropionate/cinnamic acid dioxygenase small subunit